MQLNTYKEVVDCSHAMSPQMRLPMSSKLDRIMESIWERPSQFHPFMLVVEVSVKSEPLLESSSPRVLESSSSLLQFI